MIVEHHWATRLREALAEAGGQLLVQAMIGPDLLLSVGAELEARVEAEEAIEAAEAVKLAAAMEVAQVLATAELIEEAETSAGSREQGRESLGDFKVIREIGRGGMGEVYLATDASLDRGDEFG